MSEISPTPKHALHLVLPSFPADKMNAIATPLPDTEVFTLTEASAREALEKIFAADTIAVWTELR